MYFISWNFINVYLGNTYLSTFYWVADLFKMSLWNIYFNYALETDLALFISKIYLEEDDKFGDSVLHISMILCYCILRTCDPVFIFKISNTQSCDVMPIYVWTYFTLRNETFCKSIIIIIIAGWITGGMCEQFLI